MIRILTPALTTLLCVGGLLGQDPVITKPVKPEPVTQEPVKKGPVQQEPGKPEPDKTQSPKPDQPKPEDPVIEEPEDIPLPPGASPEDIRAARSARDMLSTERRLLKRIKAGEIKGIDRLLRFDEIEDWAYQDGLKGCPEAVRKLDGTKVAMIGFMLPIEEIEHIKEFLLVQSLWACCYGTPPDINGLIRVVMKGERRTDYQFDPILVIGTLRVRETREDGYCIDIYQLECESVSTVK